MGKCLAHGSGGHPKMDEDIVYSLLKESGCDFTTTKGSAFELFFNLFFTKGNEVTDNNYCVYVHINKYNNKKYIGLTKQDPYKRWGKNGSGYNDNRQPAFSRAILKYGWDNFDHIVLYENLSKTEACDIQVKLIQIYNTQNPKYGYNIQPGGDLGNNGIVFSEESKNKMSMSHKGKTLSEEHKRKISESCKGHKPAIHTEEFKQRLRDLYTGRAVSDETREKISKANKGKKKSPQTLKKRKEHNPMNVKVYCPELDMEFLTICDASKFTGAQRSNIQKCLKGIRHTAGVNSNGEKLHWYKVEK